jgi:hypothetical protein
VRSRFRANGVITEGCGWLLLVVRSRRAADRHLGTLRLSPRIEFNAEAVSPLSELLAGRAETGHARGAPSLHSFSSAPPPATSRAPRSRGVVRWISDSREMRSRRAPAPPGPRASGCAHSGRRRRCRRRQPPIGIRERRRVRVRSSVAAASGCRNQQKQTVACQEQRTRSQRCLFAVETVHPCGRHPPHRQTAYNPTQGHHRGADQKATPPDPGFRFATRSCSRHAARGMSRENADRCSGASRHSTITTPPRFRRLARSGVELVPLALARRPFLRVGAERPVSAIAPGIGQRPACVHDSTLAESLTPEESQARGCRLGQRANRGPRGRSGFAGSLPHVARRGQS